MRDQDKRVGLVETKKRREGRDYGFLMGKDGSNELYVKRFARYVYDRADSLNRCRLSTHSSDNSLKNAV